MNLRWFSNLLKRCHGHIQDWDNSLKHDIVEALEKLNDVQASTNFSIGSSITNLPTVENILNEKQLHLTKRFLNCNQSLIKIDVSMPTEIVDNIDSNPSL